MMRSITAFFAAFGHATRGILRAFRGRNFTVMVLVAIAVVVTGLVVGLGPRRWVAVTLCIGIVLAAEMFNTAIEGLADQVHPDAHPAIRNVKDVAAGAVLVLAVAAAIVGAWVFWPYVTK